MLGDRDKMRENLLAIREDYWSNHITTHAKRLPQEKRTAAVSAVRRMAAILAGCLAAGKGGAALPDVHLQHHL